MNIRDLDLNLLHVFNSLCVHKNTVRVSRALAMSQPGVSHALSRLREAFNDPLFVRASRGLVPTPRALELESPVRALLQELEQLLTQTHEFKPKLAQKTFRIATTDFFEQIAFPPLFKRLQREAPGVTVISQPTAAMLPEAELESGFYDLAIAGFYGDVPDRFFKRVLFKDDFVCVVHRDHPRIKKTVTLDQYAAEKHVLITLNGDLKSRSAAVLKKNGLKQQYLAAVSSFAAPGWILAGSDLVLTCPKRLAETYQRYLPLRVLNLPFEVPGIHMIQVWHERNSRDPAHQWLREIVAEVCLAAR